MIENIKHTLKHTTIYGLGYAGTKIAGIILLPLYTKHIEVAEYGIFALLETTIVILSQVLILGQPNSLLRFYNLEADQDRRRSIFFTIFSLVFVCGFVFCMLMIVLVQKVSISFSWSPVFVRLLQLSSVIVFSELISLMLLTYFRSREKSTSYALANILRIVTVLAFNIHFIVFAGMGIQGIFYSSLLGNLAIIAFLAPGAVRGMSLSFDRQILGASFRFGFPLIFAGLSNMLLVMGDRYLLRWLVDYEEVGLYNLGYKIAGILNVFLIQPFMLTLLPLAYKVYQEPGDKRYLSKMMTYFVLALLMAGLAIASFSREVIEIFALEQDYWPAYTIIPLITLAYVFSGAKSVAAISLYLKSKTEYVAYTTMVAVILNIGLNLFLIPRHGMQGAAIATVITFIFLYFVVCLASQRFYRIPFENLKLLKMLCLAVLLYFFSSLTNDLQMFARMLIKIVLIASYPFLLYFVDFYEEIEIRKIKDCFSYISIKLFHFIRS
ncbi:oligosaccharide flippase family protein [bacterium]|nr:oligosaccharide flippase family protein [bacterium]